jgi:multidrug efflux pump
VVAIPVSLIGAVFLMNIAGFTINLLTLLAIVLSVGLVVDDAIVMVENIERHLAEGLQPFQAAIRAARELIGPIIAMTITLAAVYTPVAIQGGLTGSLFREFAVHAGGRGADLRHRGADAVADDGQQAAARRRYRARLRGLDQPRFDAIREATRGSSPARSSTGRWSYVLWAAWCC